MFDIVVCYQICSSRSSVIWIECSGHNILDHHELHACEVEDEDDSTIRKPDVNLAWHILAPLRACSC